MSLVWREQMSVHNSLIDREHRRLIDLVNAIERAMQSPGDGDRLLSVLDRLVEYTESHFRHEENIQKKVGYPAYEEHRQEHQELADKLAEIRAQLAAFYADAGSQGGAPRSADLAPLASLIRSWLVDHIIGCDLKMRPYLIDKPEDLY